MRKRSGDGDGSPAATETELWWTFRRTGKARCRNSIARLYEAWVVGRTKTFASARGVEWTELWGAAELGLIGAIKRFDPSCGVPFLAFAARRVDGALLDAARQAAGNGWRERRRSAYRDRRIMKEEGGEMKTSSSLPDRQAGFVLHDLAFLEEDSPLSPEEALPSREPDPSDAAAEEEIISRILDSMGSSTGDSTEDEDPRLREIARRRFVLLESIDEIGLALGLGRSRVDEILRHECLPRARGVMRRLGLEPRKRRRVG
jgi:RNA polymerase sigma factor (sigma-70 family)